MPNRWKPTSRAHEDVVKLNVLTASTSVGKVGWLPTGLLTKCVVKGTFVVRESKQFKGKHQKPDECNTVLHHF